MKHLDIILTEYDYKCADGCCDHCGIITEINGVELSCHNTDTETILKQILEHLGFEVTITNQYENEV